MNPSGVIAKSLDGRIFGGLEVSGYELPEDFSRLPLIVKNLIRKVKPDIVIGMGWDFVSKIKIERITLNVQSSIFGDAMIPDNFRHTPSGGSIIRNGQLALQASLPAEKIVKRLSREKIPAYVSYQAGTHCCNTVMYSEIFYSQKRDRKSMAGFIHIPPVPEMKVKRIGLTPMKLEKEKNAIQTALKVSRDHFRSLH